MSCQISPGPNTYLTSCKPNLMPFHIDYTGKAAISTYLLVKPAPERVAAPPMEKTSTEDAKEEGDPKAARRKIAAFRGRVVHGLELDLPQGYSGVILRKPESKSEDKNKKKEAPKSANRRSSRFFSNNASKKDEGNEEEGEEEEEKEKDAKDAVTILNPTATFGSFVLWQPDRPVNESNDEYFRALTEWTELARIMHQSE